MTTATTLSSCQKWAVWGIFLLSSAECAIMCAGWVMNTYTIAFAEEDIKGSLYPVVLYVGSGFVLALLKKSGGDLVSDNYVSYEDCEANWCHNIRHVGPAASIMAIIAWIFSAIFWLAFIYIWFKKDYNKIVRLLPLTFVAFLLALGSVCTWTMNGHTEVLPVVPVEGFPSTYYDEATRDMEVHLGITIILYIVAMIIEVFMFCLIPYTAKLLKEPATENVEMGNRK
eukprot:TRINITY_DN2329_c0_g2_i1.p1 TRINITY_DN2329_c0_g2~~TRINITY_DN2329_c0_g2_i1.p1  ORF type:complete len:227 (-),score=47.96 TRINITY_DN2329_c0_g2_i1:218-898(-)